MSKYHPIDVRYKGPSTAYRGSASKQKPGKNAATSAKQPIRKPIQKQQTQSGGANPWDGNDTSAAKAAPPRHAQPRMRQPKAKRPQLAMQLLPWPLGAIFSLFRNLGLGWSLALIYILFAVIF